MCANKPFYLVNGLRFYVYHVSETSKLRLWLGNVLLLVTRGSVMRTSVAIKTVVMRVLLLRLYSLNGYGLFDPRTLRIIDISSKVLEMDPSVSIPLKLVNQLIERPLAEGPCALYRHEHNGNAKMS